jgi:glutamate-1-semialdehyde 2,1-aminomutase
MNNSAKELFQLAENYLPGGICATARANDAFGHPFYVSKGNGSCIYDLEGNEYIDMCISHGASLLGHNHPIIKEAVNKALDLGIICAYENEYNSALAELIAEIIPCAEMVRYAGSGTETVMHALRLVRAATGREKIIKFEGHFHGYSDSLFYSSAPPLNKAGSKSKPSPFAQSSGMPKSLIHNIIIIPFNDPEVLEKTFSEHGREVATLILEPVNYDAGCIVPKPGFLRLCRELCDEYGVLLFFDEVLTAFRFALGGAQEYFGVIPDIAVLGKALGGGMPISAVVGKQDVMMHLRPVGESEMSGTYLSHSTAVLAAIAALGEYGKEDFYKNLSKLSDYFYSGFQTIIDHCGVPVILQHMGSRFGMYFGLTKGVANYREAALQNISMEHVFIAECAKRGVYFHVSPHHGFSAMHTENDLAKVLDAIELAMEQVKRSIT